MADRKVLLPAALALVVLVLMVAWMAGLFDERIAPGLDALEAAPSEVAHVVTAETVAITEPVAGSVEARQATIISSRTLARIERIHVTAGDTVREGEVLLELEQADLAARAQQASQRIEGVSARLREAERSLERARELKRRGLLASADLDAAQANRDALRAELESAQQARREAEAALEYATIRAPIDGRVVDRFAEPGDTAAPGEKLLALYNPLSLRVEARVREALALQLEAGQTLTVELPVLDERVEATIEEIVPAAQSGSRSFLVKLRLPLDGRLLPGLYARVQVPAGEEARVLVPQALVAEVGQLSVVRVAAPGGAVRRFVRLGGVEADGRVQVVAGLSPGDALLALD
jgi:membrane fusion protein (multidrug efflux system)